MLAGLPQFGCALDPTRQNDYLKAALNREELIKFSSLEVPTVNNIKIGSDQGIPHLELRVFPLQPLIKDRIRSEVSVDFPFKEGETVRYSWQFRIPENFPSDAPKNRWWIITQWHDQPDPTKGESWDTFAGKSPPLLISYGNLNEKDVIALSAGTNQTSVGVIHIKKNIWHTVRIEVTWSTTATGRVHLYFDDLTTPSLSYSGVNMNNAYQHYLKFGQYRHRDIATDNTIAFRKVDVQKIP